MIVRGDQGILLIEILQSKAVIRKVLTDEGNEDIIGKLWEGLQIAQYVAKKCATLALEAKEGMQSLKIQGVVNASHK